MNISGKLIRGGLVMLGVSAMLVGCAAPLPSYPPMAPTAAVDIMRARDGAVRTMTSTATVTLRGADGSGVSFEAVIVAKWPDHLRLRAWKFGHAAFDLTFTPEGLWVYVPDEAKRRAGEGASFDVTAEQFQRVWRLIGPRALEGAVASEQAGEIVAVRAMDAGEGSRVEFRIDPRTLTVQECRFIDPAGAVRQTLTVESYRVFGMASDGIVWPTRITAAGEQGRISIRMGTPEFNAEPAAEAFIPPRRATKQPSRATD